MKIEKLESVIKELLVRQGMLKDLRVDIKDLTDEIEVIMAQNSLEVYALTLEDDSTVNVKRRNKEKEKLDKDGLSADLDVEKKELNTKGMVKLAEEGKLTEQLLKDHTYKDKKTEVKLKVRKPRKKKDEQVQ